MKIFIAKTICSVPWQVGIVTVGIGNASRCLPTQKRKPES